MTLPESSCLANNARLFQFRVKVVERIFNGTHGNPVSSLDRNSEHSPANRGGQVKNKSFDISKTQTFQTPRIRN